MNKITYFLMLIITIILFSSCFKSTDDHPDYLKLKEAIENGNKSKVVELIEAGLKVNARSIEGRTPLMEAVINNEIEIAILLIDKGAKVNAKTYKVNPQNVIYGSDYNPVEDKTAFMFACEYKNREIAEYLIQNGAKINLQDGHDVSAFLYALNYHGEDLEFLDFLLQKGADINCNRGEALRLAARKGKVKTLKFLIEKGIDYKIKSIFNRNALMLSASGDTREHLETARYLLQYYDISDTDKYNKTALFYAAENLNLQMTSFLLQKGANINHKDDEGLTPLYYAKKASFNNKDNENIIELLIKAGATE